MRKSQRNEYLYYLVAALIATIIFGYIFIIRMPARKAENFLNSFLISSEGTQHKYIHPETIDISYLALHKAISPDFNIIKINRDSYNSYNADVDIIIPEGIITVNFIIEQHKKKYIITKLPTVKKLSGFIPLSINAKAEQPYKCEGLYKGNNKELTIPSGFKLSTNTPVTITLINNTAVLITELNRVVLQKVLSLSDNYIEDELLGRIPTNSSFSIYNTDNELSPSYKTLIPSGTKNTSVFFDTDNSISVLLYNTSLIPKQQIRAAINTTNMDSLTHDMVVLGSNESFTVETKVEPIIKLTYNNENIEFKKNDDRIIIIQDGIEVTSSSERVYVSSNEGRINLFSVKRTYTSSSLYTPYRGTIELSSGQNGINLVNELALNEYLYSVVASEMPVSFGLEALKAQAVSARTYAVSKILSGSFLSYGANIDDSTASQVYNNVSEHNETVKAVNETKRLYLSFDDKIAETKFFSTSYGFTASYGEVWGNTSEFPSPSPAYLLSRPQFPSSPPSINTEELFRAFIDKKDWDSFDNDSPFFRWSVKYTASQINSLITTYLPQLNESVGNSVFMLINNEFVRNTKLPEDLGIVTDLRIINRGTGGNITELDITMTSGTFRVIRELNIRRLLRPVSFDSSSPILLSLNNGTTRSDFSLLPSAFAYLELKKDTFSNLISLTIHGGGYGHGVGMSQYGANGMSKRGYSYSEVLAHYYPGTTISQIN